MLKIAITGNIACGKSQVENILLSKGFKVIDSDKINNDLLLYDIDVINEIKAVFTEGVFDEQGRVIKQKLGEIVFNSSLRKKQLENILHNKIMDKINEFFEENKNEKIVFASVPLLFEAKWEKNFDKIIFVSANEQLRLKRLINRNNFSVEYAKKRINAQETEQEKIKKSDFIIYNNSDLADLEKSVINMIKQFIDKRI